MISPMKSGGLAGPRPVGNLSRIRQQIRHGEERFLGLAGNRGGSDWFAANQGALRIAQLAPLAESVPPRLYGGTERVVSWLTEELVRRGHKVTLFATGDSRTSGNLVPVWPKALRLTRPHADPMAALSVALEVVARHAAEFDVLHCHWDWVHLPLLTRLGVPFITTLHGRLDLPGLPRLIETFPGTPLVSISDDQRKPLPRANWAGTVYHGFPSDLLRPSFAPGEYLAFLGRLSPEKGPEAAIRIARGVNMPLRIAAKIPRGDRSFFKDRLEPMIDGQDIRLVGEVDERSKQQFLANAAALLFPIDWPEPFGLVMIEAMACGTPVIAFRNGSVPEVIEDGVSGFIVEDEAAAIEAVRRVPQLDRRQVREAFERRFTVAEMADKYLHLYGELAERRITAA
jgi:glycosyltransferase involved in cell wall biosynthesis